MPAPLSPDLLAQLPPGWAGPPPATPPQAPPIPPAAPSPADDRGYIERGVDWLRNANASAGQSIIDALRNPGATAQSALDANARAGQAVLNANAQAGQSLLDIGKPSVEAAQAQQAAQAQAEQAAAESQATQATQYQPQEQALPQARVIPAHEGRAVSPETERMYGEAAAEKRAAIQAGEEGEQGVNEQTAQNLDKLAGTLSHQQADALRRDAERRRQYDEQWGDYQRIRREAESGEVQPGRVGFMGTLGIALGALGSGITHAPNTALQMVNDRINREMDAQRMNIANKRESARGALEGLGEMRARFGDERQAEAAERARMLEQAKAEGDAMVTRAQSPMLRAKWQAQRADFDMEIAKLHGVMFPWMQAGVAGGPGAGSIDQKLYVPRAQGIARTEQEAREMREAGAGYEKMDRLLDRSQTLRNDYKAYIPGTAAHAELQSIQAQLQPAIQESNNFKRLSDADAKFNEQMVGDLSSFAPGTSARIQAFRAQKQKEERDRYDAGGVAKTANGYAIDPRTGRIAQTGALTGHDYKPPTSASNIGRAAK